MGTRLGTSSSTFSSQAGQTIYTKNAWQVKECYYPPLLSTGENIPGLEPPDFGSPHSWLVAGAGGATQHFYSFRILSFGHGDTAWTQNSARKVRDTTDRPRPGSDCGNRRGKTKPKNVPWKRMFQLARGTSNCLTCREHMGSARSRDRATRRKIKVTTAWQWVLTRAAGRSARENIDRDPLIHASSSRSPALLGFTTCACFCTSNCVERH